LQRRLRVLSQLLAPEQIPQHAVLPNFGRPNGGETSGITIRARYLEKFCEKLVRGISFLEGGVLIRTPYRVHSFFMHDEQAESIVTMCQMFGKLYAREPGIELYRAVTPEDGVSSAYSISIWNRLKMYAVVD